MFENKAFDIEANGKAFGENEEAALEMEFSENIDGQNNLDGTEIQNDIPDNIDDIDSIDKMMDALGLTDEERETFKKIDTNIENCNIEGGIIGYKKGSCHDKQIPIYS